MPKDSKPVRRPLALIAASSHPHCKETVISPSEKQDLEQLESVIGARLNAFFEMGLALQEIKQRKLYREHFGSFEEYCLKRWDLTRSHAYRLVDAAEIYTKLSPLGDAPLPENERQLRPLRGLSSQHAEKVWKRAVEKAGGGKPTGVLVKQAVAELCGQKRKKVPPANLRENWQMQIKPLLEEAISSLKRHEKANVQKIIYRISLLLTVGETCTEEGGSSAASPLQPARSPPQSRA